MGCWADKAFLNGTTFDLNGRAYGRSNSMTIRSCGNYCLRNNYKYAGLQSGFDLKFQKPEK